MQTGRHPTLHSFHAKVDFDRTLVVYGRRLVALSSTVSTHTHAHTHTHTNTHGRTHTYTHARTTHTHTHTHIRIHAYTHTRTHNHTHTHPLTHAHPHTHLTHTHTIIRCSIKGLCRQMDQTLLTRPLKMGQPLLTTYLQVIFVEHSSYPCQWSQQL